MSKIKNIKTFKKHPYQVAVRQLEKQKSEVILLHQMYDVHFGIEVHTIDTLNTWLKEKTGFDNPVMSADSLGKKTAYDTIIMMSSSVKLDKFNSDGTIKKSVLKDLKESFTTYYTDDEYRYLQKVLKVVDAMNTIHKYDGMSINFSTLEDKFTYRKDVANSYKAFART
jgi:hypothetical protein